MAENLKDGPKAKAGHNGMDPEKLQAFVEAIDEHEAKKASAQGEYMQICKVQTEAINDILNDAKEAGIPKKELRRVLKVRKLEKKAAQERNDLDIVERETFDQIRFALGDLADTPLGEAATPADEDTNVVKMDSFGEGAE